MSNPPQLELLCPKCNVDVQPIKAAYNWFCPNCAWQFTKEDVERQLRRQKSDRSDPRKGDPPSSDSPAP